MSDILSSALYTDIYKLSCGLWILELSFYTTLVTLLTLTLEEGSGQQQLWDSWVQEKSNWPMGLTHSKLQSGLEHTNAYSTCYISKHFFKNK